MPRKSRLDGKVLVEIFQYTGFIEVILEKRLVCRAWAKVLVSDEVWSVSLRTDHYMYLKWSAYDDERQLTRPSPMQPEPVRTMFQWYKWYKQQMIEERELQHRRKSLDALGSEEDAAFAQTVSQRQCTQPLDIQQSEEETHHIAALVRTSVMLFTDITCIHPASSNSGQHSVVAMGCADGKVLLLDPNNPTGHPTDPSVAPKLETIDEHDSRVTCMMISTHYFFTCSADCTVACYSFGAILRPLVVLIGHSEEVTCIVCHPDDDSQVVTGSLDRQVLIWKVDTSNKPTAVCRGHSMKVVSLQTTANLIFSGSRDSSIHVWDWQGHRLRVLTGHVGPIVGLGALRVPMASGGHACRLVSACAAGMVRLWNSLSCRVVSSAVLVKALTCLCTYQPLALVIIGAFDGLVVVQDTSENVIHLAFHNAAVRLMQTTSPHLYTGADDCRVAIWSLVATHALLEGRKQPKKSVPTLAPFRVLHHPAYLTAFYVTNTSPGSRQTLVTSTSNKRCHLWRSDPNSDAPLDCRAQLPNQTNVAVVDKGTPTKSKPKAMAIPVLKSITKSGTPSKTDKGKVPKAKK